MRDAAEAGIALLGVCFGGQLLAQTFGGSVARSPHPEIGWYDVASDRPDIDPAVARGSSGTSTGGPCRRGRPRSPATGNASQAFVLGRAMALQFHPEVDADLLKLWLADDRDDEVVAAGLTHDELLTRTAELAADTASRMRRLVRGFLTYVVRQPCPS